MIYIVLICIIVTLIFALVCAKKVSTIKNQMIIDILMLSIMLIFWLIFDMKINALIVYSTFVGWCIIGLSCKFLSRKLPEWISPFSLKMNISLDTKKAFLTDSQLFGINVWFYHLKFILAILFIFICLD